MGHTLFYYFDLYYMGPIQITIMQRSAILRLDTNVGPCTNGTIFNDLLHTLDHWRSVTCIIVNLYIEHGGHCRGISLACT